MRHFAQIPQKNLSFGRIFRELSFEGAFAVALLEVFPDALLPDFRDFFDVFFLGFFSIFNDIDTNV